MLDCLYIDQLIGISGFAVTWLAVRLWHHILHKQMCARKSLPRFVVSICCEQTASCFVALRFEWIISISWKTVVFTKRRRITSCVRIVQVGVYEISTSIIVVQATITCYIWVIYPNSTKRLCFCGSETFHCIDKERNHLSRPWGVCLCVYLPLHF